MTEWRWNGARWWKFDVHAHTPASKDYGKGKNQTSLRELSPKEWLLTYMRAGIDCIAITDHANIVVNGYAEQVVALAQRSGETEKECEGSMQ